MKPGNHEHDPYDWRTHWKAKVVLICLALFYCGHLVRSYLYSDWWFSERLPLGEIIAFQQRNGDIPALLLLNTSHHSGMLHAADGGVQHTVSTAVIVTQGPSGPDYYHISGHNLGFTLIADNAGPRFYTCRECTGRNGHTHLPVLWEAVPATPAH